MLKIIRAIYFDPELGVDDGIDVAIELLSETRNNQIVYNGNYNRIFPDHFKNKRKKLRINLEYNGKKYKKQYDENEKINIPIDLGIVSQRWWKNHGFKL